MKVVEINSGFRGSTGTIMLSIADLVRSCGGEAYTFSEKKLGAAPNGHQFFGTKFENLFHRGVSVFSGISGKGSKSGTKELLKQIDAIHPDILHLQCKNVKSGKRGAMIARDIGFILTLL